MALSPGKRLGPYEITGAIGAGGMGEVYHARDTRLDRSVAIKVLSDHLEVTPDVRARFEREARAVSSLNHPHICTLYDVGRQDDMEYLVMEYLEGETLAQRLEQGPLDADEVLRIGIQIADALEKAHRQGLVHRDLKPANVMLTKSGAKVLDFGLARSINNGGAVQMSSPTMSRPITAEGRIVGTFQYMAPEQLEGKEADARSDLWALGATLYEMTTGKKAFEGTSQASLISSIMKDQPRPIPELQPIGPPGLDRVVRQCLAKDPDDRIQTAHDVRLHLEWIAEGGSQAGVPAFVASRRRRREKATLALAGVATIAAVSSVGWIQFHQPKAPESIRFQFVPPSSIQFSDAPRLSPNGRFVAFNATDSTGVSRVWTRPLDALQANALPGTEGAGRPFWSPDSRYLGFFASGKLKKIQVAGGPPVVICDAPTGSDATWGRANVILYDGRQRDPLYRVSAGGGVPTPVVAADSVAGERFVGWPEFLPDGRRFIYMAGGTKTVLKLGKLDSKLGRELFPCDSRAQYSPPGFLVFSRGGTLVAQPFDVSAGKAKGDPIPIAEEVVTNAVGGADFSVSSTGVLAYTNRRGQLGRLVKLDRTGRVMGTHSSAGDVLHPSLSPDLRKVALRIRDFQSQTRDIWVVDLARSVTSRLTFEPGNENYPVWSPDGTRLIYYSDSDAPGLYVRYSTGAGRSEQILASSQEAVALDWSRDGRFVLYSLTSPRGGSDIWVLPMSGKEKPRPLLDGPFDEFQARLSPDGRWMAYMSNESGREEVYVQSFPEPGGKWQVSTRGGSDPVWRPDGRELFYLSADQQIMSMPLAASPTFEVAVPQPLFTIRVLLPSGARNHYAVTPDGQTFYAVSPLEGEAVGATTVVVNWNADLKKR